VNKLKLVVFSLVILLCGCSQPLTHTVPLAAGGEHTCALSEAGGVRCWGANAQGQLGNGTVANSTLPVEVAGLDTAIVAVAAGGRHTCALDTLGRVWCWGANAHGQLGNGSLTDSSVAVKVAFLDRNIVAITAGDRHTCALSAQGRISCWGANDSGQLGSLGKKDSGLPVAVSGLDGGMQAVAAGEAHTCALTSAGGVKCWGANTYGQLGDRSQKASALPVDVDGLGGAVAAIAAGGGQSCAISAAGGVTCWGWDGNEIANTYVLKPKVVGGVDSGAQAVAVGGEHACVLFAGGRVKCWGNNYAGELGNETLPASSTPLPIGGLASGVLAIAAGDFHTCAVSAGVGVQCWGQNDQGELGGSNKPYSAAPVRVSNLKMVALAPLAVTAAPTPTRVPPTLVPWPSVTPLPAPQAGQAVSLSWLDMLDETNGWGIDAQGAILRTSDGGTSWKPAGPPAGTYNGRSFYVVDAGHAWAAALQVLPGSDGCERVANCHLGATVWRTSDGGETWQSSQAWIPAQPLARPAGSAGEDSPSSATAHNQYYLDPVTGWVLLEDWGTDTNILTVLARTTDGGQTLRELWRDEGIGRYSGIVFLNKLTGYLGLDETTFFNRLSGVPALKDYLTGAERPYLLKTTNGGRTWDVYYLPKPNPIPDDLKVLQETSERMLCGVDRLASIQAQAIVAEVVCRATGRFAPFMFYYLSSDGGTTWHSWVASGNESFLNSRVGWRLAYSGEFQQTGDGGRDWTTIATLPWREARFDIVNEQTGWALVGGADGQAVLMHTVDGGHHWAILQPVVVR